MAIARAATAFWHHFHPWTIENMDLETVCHFGTPNIRENHKHVSKVGPMRHPKRTPKSINMGTWTSRCLLCVPVEPWITKMVTQGTRNGASRSNVRMC